MNFDIGAVLTRAWQITWKNKVLWLAGAVFGLFFSILLPLAMTPAFLPEIMRNTELNRSAGFLLAALVIVFSLFFILMFPLSVLTQTMLTLGVLHISQDDGELSIVGLLRESRPYFIRVLGLMLLYSLGTTIIILIVEAFVILIAIFTFGLGMLCMMPIMLLIYPAMFFTIIWMEQSMNGIVIDNRTVMDAIQQSWYLIRKNLLTFGLMALVIYFGVGMINGVLMMPFMTPIFIAPISLMESNDPNWSILFVSLLCMVASIPVFALVFGWIMAFTKSAWVITYLHLTRPVNKHQLVLQETTT